MSDSPHPEQLWARAHEHVQRGDFASAVRCLAQCFQLLQANNDPRLYEVHKRWTEVHTMYLEATANERKKAAPQNARPAPTSAPFTSVDAAPLPAARDAPTTTVPIKPDDDDWSDVSIDSGPVAIAPGPRTVAPAMAVDDAPVGMQSLDVPFSVGPSIDSSEAAVLSVQAPLMSAKRDVAFLEDLLRRVQANRRPPLSGA